MPIINVFSNNVEYIYKVRFFSVAAFVVSTLLKLMITSPLLFIYHSGGFWIGTKTYWERPDINFKYKYFLMIDQKNSPSPLICSTFTHYKDNLIKDSCNLVKVVEEENRKNKLKESLSFQVRFFSDKPIQSILLLLFFNYEMKEFIQINTEVMSIFEYDTVKDIQELHISGDLGLRQHHALMHDGIYNVQDNTTELNDFTLEELLNENYKRLLSAKLSNVLTRVKSSFNENKPVSIKCNLSYGIQSINYRPGFWEEIRWAWMQYIALFVITSYFIRKILTKAFTTKKLRSYIVVPWAEHRN